MRTWRRLRHELRTPVGLAALVGVIGLLALAVVAPVVWGDTAGYSDPTQILRPPSAEHLFGTDAGGRDIWLRTLVATRRSVLMALVAVALGVSLGVLLGVLPLLLPGRPGRWVVAAINVGVAFPALLLAISLSVILGQDALAATVAIAVAIAPGYARLTYTLGSSAWGRDYVSAARVLGVPAPVVVWRHVLPNIRDPLLVNATISAGTALVAFASLSFLGLGVQPPDYDWGRMLNEGLSRIFVAAPAALVPGVAIIAAGLVFALAGETLSRALLPGSGVGVLRARKARSLAAAYAAERGEAEPVPDADDPDGLVLSVRDLRVAVPREDRVEELVRGVSFDVRRGEVVGIVGESGSGKSLTLMAVAGLLERPLLVSAQRLVVDGTELPARAGGLPRRLARTLATRLSLVYQDPVSSLNPALSVGRQVSEVGELHLGLRGAASRARGVEALAQARVPEPERRYDQYPHELSGGLRQRAVIAMGLVTTPAVLLADEPTTALDVTVQAEVLDLLRRINREEGAAVVLVSHDLAVVASVCTRVLVMYRGRVVETLTVEELRSGTARHPYTQALVAAVPTMATDRDAPLASIPEGADFDDVPPIGSPR